MADSVVSFSDSLLPGSSSDASPRSSLEQASARVHAAGVSQYFITSDLEALLSTLSQQILSDRIQILIGRPGSGKSQLLNELLDSLGNKIDVRHIQSGSVLGEKQLISLLADAILSETCVSLDELKEGINSVFTNHNKMVLLIEDAHNLSPFAINLLIELKKYAVQESLPLFVVLLARTEIESTLESISLNKIDEYIDIYYMPRFSLEQTLAYIKARLIAAGYEFNIISLQVWKSVHKKSDGWPAAINHFVDMHLLENLNNNRLQIWLNEYHSTIINFLGKLAIVATLIFIAMIFYDATRSTDMAHLKVETSSFNLPTLDVFVQQKIPFAKEQAEKIMTRKLSSAVPEVLVAEVEKQKISIKKPQVSVVKETLSMDGYKHALSQLSPIDNGNQWLLQQVEGTYTVQLAASANKTNITAFIKKHLLNKKFTDIRLQRNQRDWFVLVVGAFDTVSQARAFVALMPATLTKNNPWIRQISSLQNKVGGNTVAMRMIDSKQKSSGLGGEQKSGLAVTMSNDGALFFSSNIVTGLATLKEGEFEAIVPPL